MPSLADFRAAAERVRNWGRWGVDDQLGTLNLITDEKVAESARLVKRGRLFSLSISWDSNGVWAGGAIRQNPVHLMRVDGGDRDDPRWQRLARYNDDFIAMPLQAATHWDALSHVYYDEQMYNGVPAAAVTSAGATRNGIEHVDARGVVSRAVLVDIPRHRGVATIPAGSEIEPEELDAALAAQGARLAPGDVLLVRTGWWSQFNVREASAWRDGSPGLSWRCAEWLHQHQVAAVAADNIAVETSNYKGSEVVLPLHLLCLRDMGMVFGELWNLDALAEDCAVEGTFDCQLIAAPIRVTGAVGAPANPIAIR